MAFTLTSNIASPAVLIKDLGIVVPGAGGSLVFTTPSEINEITLSSDVQKLTTDLAFNAGTENTLVLNNGVTDIAPADIPTVFAPAAVNILKENLSATIDPSTTNDINDGYSVGSHWINIIGDRVFVCTDTTANSAKWTLLSDERIKVIHISANTILPNGRNLLVLIEANSLTITLPEIVGATGLIFILKNVVGTNTTVIANGTELIDDDSFEDITGNKSSASFVSDGTNWSIF